MEAIGYTSNNRKEQGSDKQEEEEGEGMGGVAAGDPIKIFDKHCSTPRQKKIWIKMT